MITVSNLDGVTGKARVLLSDALSDALDRIRSGYRSSMEAMWDAGFTLNEAKRQVTHGDWMEFVRDHGLTQPTANRWMRIAAHYGRDEIGQYRTLREALAPIKPPPIDVNLPPMEPGGTRGKITAPPPVDERVEEIESLRTELAESEQRREELEDRHHDDSVRASIQVDEAATIQRLLKRIENLKRELYAMTYRGNRLSSRIRLLNELLVKNGIELPDWEEVK